ncbi:MAG: hydrogenase maturation nickel metallochaperone HypA, partial [Candidatus Thermoplasmatota archaeon]|nr:hydrogenase maturation nickel metallochaperone HypA [Candidatus Thermoplasmatota archaeon]
MPALHELQIASNLVSAVMETVRRYENVERVDTVNISIGRLTFVGEEQIKFCWGAITEEDPILKGSELVIGAEEVEIECSACGYLGEMEIKEDPIYHYMTPV